MKCEYCERTFKEGPVKKTLRGKSHVFCSESCFNLFFYEYPRYDMERMYKEFTVSVEIPDIGELIDEEV